MSTYTIRAVDPDEDFAEGTVTVMHGVSRGEALARGCEAILDGYIDVRVEGPMGQVTRLIDPAAA
jgi:hypothetical protein